MPRIETREIRDFAISLLRARALLTSTSMSRVMQALGPNAASIDTEIGGALRWSRPSEGFRRFACNAILAASFFVAAIPNAQRFDTGVANAIWVVGAIVTGAFSLVRFAPKSVRLDIKAYAATMGMLAMPCMMRPENSTSGALAAVAIAIELAGVFVSQAARIWMGRSFGILPANRGIVRDGPFRLVRHPIYFGWLMLTVGYALSYPSVRNLLALGASIPFLIWRIGQEEGLLARDPAYRDYLRYVRFRLVPGII